MPVEPTLLQEDQKQGEPSGGFSAGQDSLAVWAGVCLVGAVYFIFRTL